MISDYQESLPQRMSFIILPGFSLIGFSAMLEPLRWANSIAGKSLYQWQVVSIDGEPVAASNEMTLLADCSIEDANETDAVIVCAGFDPHEHVSKTLINALRRFSRQGADLGAQDTGAHILAAGGFLDNYRATIHWENLNSFAEEFPKVKVVKDIFEIDRNRFSCSGGMSGLDLMLYVIRGQHGEDLAISVSDELVYSHIRGADHPQRVSLQTRLGVTNAKLISAIKVMQRCLEDPMSIPSLSEEVHVSERELERLFRKHLNITPSAYYRNLRLEQARQLLQQTNRSITNIAVSCGFTSASHFSRTYHSKFDVAPSRDRRVER